MFASGGLGPTVVRLHGSGETGDIRALLASGLTRDHTGEGLTDTTDLNLADPPSHQ